MTTPVSIGSLERGFLPSPSPSPQHGRRRFASAAAVSVALHGAVIAIALAHWGPPLRGGGGQQLGAMIIEIVDATAVDSVRKTVQTGAAGDGELADSDGQAHAQPPTVTGTTTPTVTRPATDALPPADGPDPVAMAALTPDGVNHDPRAKNTELKTPRDQPPEMAAPPSAAVPLSVAGGSTSVAMADANAQPSAAAASPGDIERYRNDVRQALGRQPPRRGLAHGALTQSQARAASVVIGFGVSDRGRVENVQLLEASRNSELNALLLTWIGNAALPAPPPGLSAADRRFSLPLTIR